jgi:hypothetical protein
MDSLGPILKELESLTLCQLVDALGPSCRLEIGLKPIDPDLASVARL